MWSPKSSRRLLGRLPLNSGETSNYQESPLERYCIPKLVLPLETGTFQDAASKLFKRLPNDIKLAKRVFKLFQTEAESRLNDFLFFCFVWLSYYFQLYTPTCTLIFIRIRHVIKWDRFDECRLLRKIVIKRPFLLWKTLMEKYCPE